MTTPTTAPADELLRAMQDDGIIAAAPPEALPAHQPGPYPKRADVTVAESLA